MVNSGIVDWVDSFYAKLEKSMCLYDTNKTYRVFSNGSQIKRYSSFVKKKIKTTCSLRRRNAGHV